MELSLAQGAVVYAGTDGAPPDMPYPGTQGYVSRRDAYAYDSSSDSSSDDDRRSRSDRKRERRERKAEKREMKRDRRQNKRAQKSSKKEMWRLIVAFRPSMA